MNIKKQYSIREYGLPSVFSGTNILSTTEAGDYWVINGVKTNIKVKQASDPESDPGIVINNANDLAFYEPPSGQPVTNYIFQKNLELLNSRINAIHKELTYWDLYKLTASVENAEDLDAIFSSLSVGQSMVINCPTFTKGGIKYSRGDVIVRTTDSSEIKIDALSTGLFYPQAIKKESGNVFTITYSYFEGTPKQDADPVKIDITAQNPIQPVQNHVLPPTIEFENLSDVAGTIYGFIRKFEDGTTGDDVTLGSSFDVLYENNDATKIILPIIKCFDDNYEEINLDRSRVWIELKTVSSVKKWEIHCNADNVKNILRFVQVK